MFERNVCFCKYECDWVVMSTSYDGDTAKEGGGETSVRKRRGLNGCILVQALDLKTPGCSDDAYTLVHTTREHVFA